MKNKEVYYIVLLIIGIVISIITIANNTRAIPIIDEKDYKFQIYSDLDETEFTNNVKQFISNNDDLLIGLSSYEMSDDLYNNYDYITLIAENYILEHYKDYKEKIKDNKIDIKYIYEITYNFFGKKDYYIKDIINNQIALKKDTRRFSMEIENITIDNNNKNVSVSYKLAEEKLLYKYYLEQKDDIYIIKNIEVES